MMNETIKHIYLIMLTQDGKVKEAKTHNDGSYLIILSHVYGVYTSSESKETKYYYGRTCFKLGEKETTRCWSYDDESKFYRVAEQHHRMPRIDYNKGTTTGDWDGYKCSY